MKTTTAIVLALVSLTGLASLRGQGAWELRADLVAPENPFWQGTGTFSLNDVSLSYVVGVRGFVVQASLNGPAGPGGSAAPVFYLNYARGIAPDEWFAGETWWEGSLTLSGQQRSDLLAGLYYVSVFGFRYPNHELRGQVLLVPEPPTGALWVLAGLGLWGVHRGRRCQGRRTSSWPRPTSWTGSESARTRQ